MKEEQERAIKQQEEELRAKQEALAQQERLIQQKKEQFEREEKARYYLKIIRYKTGEQWI